ncbi:MAG: gluconate 2-dehydrogenase subunit 3 family protein [Haloarculaceae archaeon]
MQLTRRDALAVLAGAGIVAGGGAAALARDGFRDDAGGGSGGGEERGEGDVDALVGALVGTARAVYPSEVGNVGAFVETYAATKLERRPEFREGVTETLADLDAEARITFESAFGDLDPVETETVLRRTGAATAEPDPDGTAAERVRYYFVNEVVYALYTSPTGGELVGVENPQGHPGGTDSYRRGPDR